MAQQNEFVVFAIDDQQFAVALSNVERVLHAVEISPLHGAPSNVIGVINFQGRAVPVINSRRVLGAPERGLDLDDVFIFVRNGGPTVALIADSVEPATEIDQDRIVSAEQVLAGLSPYGGVATDDEGMTVLVTVHRILSVDDRARLQDALDNLGGPDHVG